MWLPYLRTSEVHGLEHASQVVTRKLQVAHGVTVQCIANLTRVLHSALSLAVQSLPERQCPYYIIDHCLHL